MSDANTSLATDLARTLRTAGVEDEDANLLAVLVARPAIGTFAAEESTGASDARVALLALLVAAADYRRFPRAITALMTFLAPRQAALSAYDMGRYLHLAGFVAWRIEDALYVATRSLNRSVEVLRAVESDEARAYLTRVHDTFGQILGQQGLLEDARLELEVALAGRRHEGDEAGLAITLGNLGRLCIDAGDWAAGERYLTEDIALIERISPEKTRLRAMLEGYVGTSSLRDGRLDEAEQRFRASAQLAAESLDSVGGAFAEIGLGWLALRRGHAGDARDHCDSAKARLAHTSAIPAIDGDVRPRALHLDAATMLASGDAARAVDIFREASTAMAKSVGFSPVDRASVLHDLSRALAATGDAQEASMRLRDALRCLDATAAESMRSNIEAELRERFPDAWLLHSAGRFVGHEQIEFLLGEAGHGGFRGERREVAVLFSDVRGFTSLSERLPPESVIALLNDFLGHMTRCIEGVGGMIDKFIGDAVMAIFSLPVPHADDAERALVAALSMSDELQRFNRKFEGPPLAVGIGIHFGSVVAGLIGSPQKRSYTVIGDVVNTASRLEGMTKQLGASILVTEALIERLPRKERFLLRPLGSYRPKGRVGAISCYDVMGERDAGPLSTAADAEISSATGALDALRARRFVEATAAFQGLAQSCGPKHAPGYELLARSAVAFAAQAPGEEWRGEVVLLEK